MTRGMNSKISQQIQEEQNHGRQKYGGVYLDEFSHDDQNPTYVWINCIRDHLERARQGTPMEYRQHLIKVAGLAVSAVESFDRKQQLK
jgi:hypothetical protein